MSDGELPLAGKGQQLARLLYDRLRDDISAGRLQPGDRLTERELSQRFGASRTPGREALHRLHSEGFLSSSGKSLTVTDVTLGELMDGFRLRGAILSIVIELAVQRGRPEDFDRMGAILAAIRSAIAEERGEDAVRLSIAFDKAMFAAAHSESIARAYDSASGSPGLAVRMLTHSGRLNSATDERGALLEALRARDVERALAAGQAFVEAGRRHCYEVAIAAEAARNLS